MTDFDQFKWNSDDYENNFGSYLEPVKPSYRETIPKKKEKKQRTWLVAMSSAMVGALIMAIVSPMMTPLINNITGNSKKFAIENKTQSSSTDVTPVAYSASNRQELSTVEIGKTVGPAVVGIVTSIEYKGFFNQTASGSGSGIVISSDGYIVTNHHVINGASTVTVHLNNGTQYPASLVGSDERTDLAVIKIDAKDLTVATLGDSDLLQAGEKAIAIGNPLGQEFAGTLTSGIISALNRTITVDNKTFTMIQTDAAINPGNSGGALVNAYGEVIGINTVKVSASEVEGLGFAIPINSAKPIVEDLINYKYVKGRPLIGLSLRYITKQEAEYYNIASEGLFVVEVAQYSGAEKAGVKRGDVVLKCNGAAIKSVEELNAIRDKCKAGDTLKLELNRDGTIMTVDVVLTEDKPALTNN